MRKLLRNLNIVNMNTTKLKANLQKAGFLNLAKFSFFFAISIVLFGVVAGSCKKERVKSVYYVRMTDAPGNYDQVNIDLKSVELTGDGGTTVTLNTTAGIYNLLNFSNGLDTMIATGALGLKTVEQIRLVLGPNNTVMVDSVIYPLSTPSAEQSGLKLQVHQTLNPGVAYIVLLDFDANASIVQTGNGQYKLKPVVRTIETAISGSVMGKILPVGTIATVTADLNGTIYSSTVNAHGEFLIKGLPSGTYSVTITPAAPLSAVTLNNVIVNVGVSTDVGVIQL
jgi:hypothetical protein